MLLLARRIKLIKAFRAEAVGLTSHVGSEEAPKAISRGKSKLRQGLGCASDVIVHQQTMDRRGDLTKDRRPFCCRRTQTKTSTSIKQTL